METKSRVGTVGTRSKVGLALAAIIAAGAIVPNAATLAREGNAQQPGTQLRNHTGDRTEQARTASATSGSDTSSAISLGNMLTTGPSYHRRGSGLTPKEWGMSAACARMVRKNRLHRAGLSHARI